MIKIRLMRIGAKQKPFYRIVVVDERSKRTGAYIELLGTYNPLTEPKDIKLKQERIDYWIKQGAQPSTGYLRMIGKAPQRPPRKPKKEQKAKESSAVSPQPSEIKEKSSGKPAEIPNTEKEAVVDDSAVKTESAESDTSESVQNKKNERPT